MSDVSLGADAATECPHVDFVSIKLHDFSPWPLPNLLLNRIALLIPQQNVVAWVPVAEVV